MQGALLPAKCFQVPFPEDSDARASAPWGCRAKQKKWGQHGVSGTAVGSEGLGDPGSLQSCHRLTVWPRTLLPLSTCS